MEEDVGRGFHFVLKELLELKAGTNQSSNDSNRSFDRVLLELMAEREKAAVAAERNKQQEDFHQERQDMMMRLQKQQEEYQMRQDQLLARQDRERQEAQQRQDQVVTQIFEVVNQQKEELNFFRTGGSGGSNFGSTTFSELNQKKNMSQDLTPSSKSGEERNRDDELSKLREQQEAMVRLLKRKEEEIHDLRAGGDGGDGGNGGDGGDGDDYGDVDGGGSIKFPLDKIRFADNAQRLQQQKFETRSKSKGDKSEFDSLQEIEAYQNESADFEVSELFLSTPVSSEYKVSNVLGAKSDKGGSKVEGSEGENKPPPLMVRDEDQRMTGPPVLCDEDRKMTGHVAFEETFLLNKNGQVGNDVENSKGEKPLTSIIASSKSSKLKAAKEKMKIIAGEIELIIIRIAAMLFVRSMQMGRIFFSNHKCSDDASDTATQQISRTNNSLKSFDRSKT